MPLWAFFGLGMMELIVLGIIGTAVMVPVVAIVVVVLLVSRKKDETRND
jgi:hypothetical protein